MPIGSEIFIVDTSCLILLSKIGELSLLKAFKRKVLVTDINKEEFSIQLPKWINITNPTNHQYQTILQMDLDKGEASAIALTLETPDSLLFIDDLKGRKIAEKLNLNYSGTFGLILKAKREGIITSIRPVMNRIVETNFRFDPALIDTILKDAGEL